MRRPEVHLLLTLLVLGLTVSGCEGGKTQAPASPSSSSEPADATPEPADATPEPADATPAAPADDVDTDGDGLTDARELELGTDPRLEDTDGDGRDDNLEASDNTSEGSSYLVFSPTIADLPVGAVQLTSQPIVTFHEKLGVSKEYSSVLEKSDTVSREQRTSNGGSVSRAVEESFSVSASVTVTAEVSLTSVGGSASATAGMESTNSVSEESSAQWSQEKSLARSMALTQAESNTRGMSTESEGGKVLIAAELVNRGNTTWSLKSLKLAAYTLDPRTGAVATLFPSLVQSGGVSDTSVKPGKSVGPLTFEAELTLGQMKEFLANPGGLIISASHMELLNRDGVAFAHNMTEVMQRTAHVVIDYGQKGEGHLGSGVSEHWVAIPGQHPKGMSLKQLLEGALRLKLETGAPQVQLPLQREPAKTFEGLLGVGDVGAGGKNGFWVVVHRKVKDGGQAYELVEYNPLKESFRPEEIMVQRREAVQLVFVSDADGDGLADRSEYRYGTDPKVPDTDGDGLLDGREVIGWELADGTRVSSNPLVQDADLDGANDLQEFEARTHPWRLVFKGTVPVIERCEVIVTRNKEFDGSYDIAVKLLVQDPDPEDKTVHANVLWPSGQTRVDIQPGVEHTIKSRSPFSARWDYKKQPYVTVNIHDSSFKESMSKMLPLLRDLKAERERFREQLKGPDGKVPENAMELFAFSVATEHPELYYHVKRFWHHAVREKVPFKLP